MIGGDQAQRVLRGGAWFIIPWFLRPANRNYGSWGVQFSDTGMRIARTN